MWNNNLKAIQTPCSISYPENVDFKTIKAMDEWKAFQERVRGWEVHPDLPKRQRRMVVGAKEAFTRDDTEVTKAMRDIFTNKYGDMVAEGVMIRTLFNTLAGVTENQVKDVLAHAQARRETDKK